MKTNSGLRFRGLLEEADLFKLMAINTGLALAAQALWSARDLADAKRILGTFVDIATQVEQAKIRASLPARPISGS